MTFANLNLIEPLLRVIDDCGYKTATSIQIKAIPMILAGSDLLACAQTGTGKTAAFALPLLQILTKKSQVGANQSRVLIIAPTRELAAQIHENILTYCRYMEIRTAVVFGGVKINPQMMKLRRGVDILVATPGRLLDLHKQNALNLNQVETLVLDEADRMLDMGFINDIKKIISLLPSLRQRLLFSATFSNEIRKLAKVFLKNPVEIDVSQSNVAANKVIQTIHPVDKARKSALLSHLIREKNWHQALVFARTKHGANRLVKSLAQDKILSMAIHGNKSQAQRSRALNDFKLGKLQILVATDIASRGIDIAELPMVINFELPQTPEDYVHRIGRTGRAGSAGLAISLVCADEFKQLKDIEILLKKRIERIEIDDFEPTHQIPSASTSTQVKKYVAKSKAATSWRKRSPN